MQNLIDLNVKDVDGISVGDYIRARVEHIIDDLEVLAVEHKLHGTEEYITIQYQAMQILAQLNLN